MRLFKSRVWSFWDAGWLKAYGFVVGLIIGAYLSPVVKEYVWLFIAVALILMIRILYVYFFKKTA